VLLAALRTGELSAGQGDAIRANVPKPLAELFAEHASWVVPELIGLSVNDTAIFMAQWRERAEATLDPAEPPTANRSLGRELEMLLCDATIQRILAAGTVTIDLGHRVYVVSDHIWDTIAIRDQKCRFDNHCTAKPTRCDAHHVVAFPAGPTVQVNLVLLCEKHHWRLHRPGWHGRLDDDSVFHVTDPRGHSWITHPNGPSLAAQARAKQERKAQARAEQQQAKTRRPATTPTPSRFPSAARTDYARGAPRRARGRTR
jgi:hypothetical protein